MKKQGVSLLSAFFILFACIVPVFADEAPQICGEKLECESGETVDYSVSILNNPGIAGCVVGVACESDWFYFDDKASQGDFSDQGSITCSNDVRFMNVAWYNTDDVSDNGVLFTVKVHVSPSTPDGEYPITIMYSKEDTIDSKCNEMEFETVDGSITVKHVEVKNVADNAAPAVNVTSDGGDRDAETSIKPWLIAVGVAVAVIAVVFCVINGKNKKTK